LEKGKQKERKSSSSERIFSGGRKGEKGRPSVLGGDGGTKKARHAPLSEGGRGKKVVCQKKGSKALIIGKEEVAPIRKKKEREGKEVGGDLSTRGIFLSRKKGAQHLH